MALCPTVCLSVCLAVRHKSVLYQNEPDIERIEAVADILRSAYAVIATKSIHRLQIRQIVHNYRAPPTISPSYIRVHAVVWECGDGQPDTHTQAHTCT